MQHNTMLKQSRLEAWIPLGPLGRVQPLHFSPTVDTTSKNFKYLFHSIKAQCNYNIPYLCCIFDEDIKSPFANSCHFLRMQVVLSSNVLELKERLSDIEHWVLTNIDVGDCGFYSGLRNPIEKDSMSMATWYKDARGATIAAIAHVHTIAVFKHSEDLLAFKINFML